MKFLGVVILGVGVGGTPPPEIFWTKMLFFLHILPIFEVMGLKIIRGSVPPSPRGAMPPLNFFCVLNSGWLGAFTGTLPWLDFVVFGL